MPVRFIACGRDRTWLLCLAYIQRLPERDCGFKSCRPYQRGFDMIEKIQVYNRQSMDALARYGKESGFPFFDRTWHLVSIHGDSKQFLTPAVTKVLKRYGMGECLSMDFWDITDNPDTIVWLKQSYPQYRLFTRDQAVEVVAFLEARKVESDGDVFVCHCDAGISRSGAVATFACELFGLDYFEFLTDNPRLKPNPMVLRMLRETVGLGGKTAFMTAMEAEKEKQRKEIGKLLDQCGSIF